MKSCNGTNYLSKHSWIALVGMAIALCCRAARADSLYVANGGDLVNEYTLSNSGTTATAIPSEPLFTIPPSNMSNADAHQMVTAGPYLFVANDSATQTVGEYNLITNSYSTLISGIADPVGVAFYGNDLYVANYTTQGNRF